MGTFKATRGLPPEFDDVNLKQKKTPKQKTKTANNAKKNEVAITTDTYLSEAIKKHPRVPTQSVKPADYYRDGKLASDSKGMHDPENKKFSSYEIQPRTLDMGNKDDPAVIRVIGKVKKGAKSVDTDIIPPFSKFFLQSSQEGHTERSQVVETFGDFYAFFFGERPPIYTYSGTLLNSSNINWLNDFYFYYDNFLRGTKCAEYKARLVMTYSNSQVEGYMLGFNIAQNAELEAGVQISFQILILDRKILKLSQDFGILDMNGKYIADKNILSMLTKGLSEGYASDAYNKAKDAVNGDSPANDTEQPQASTIDKIKDKFSMSNIKQMFNGKLGLG